MNKNVKVTADATGSVVAVSQNPEFGYIRVEQRRMLLDENNWLRPRMVSALIHGKIADLKLYGWKAEQALDGKIVIQESLTPFNKKEPERDIKIAGKTGIICTLQGAPIYRRHIWDETGSKADELVQHDNVAVIREAFQKLELQEKETGDLQDPK